MRSKKKPVQFSFWQTIAFVLVAILLTFWLTKLFQTADLPKPSFITSVSKIDASTLKETLEKKDFTLINVHTPYEGEIEKTDAFIEFDKIDENKNKLPQDKNAKIILYCQSGRMSEEAGKKLVSLGFTNVAHLSGGMEAWKKAGNKTFNVEEIKKTVLSEKGFSLPIKWGRLGPTLVSLGVIDLEKFEQGVKPTEEQLTILQKESDQPISINEKNSQFVVDVLWALGLAQKSKVYTDGPMGQEYKERVDSFASTGGWTLAKGKAVDYLGKYEIIKLTSEQQDKVFEISKNIYRPCCGNPTSFPDCNHGMAALALIELMIAEGFSDNEVYNGVLGFNSFWFPQTYVSLAAYFAKQGISRDKIEAKKILSEEFSGGSGASKIAQEIGRLPHLFGSGGGGCGV